ncbi:type IV secretion system protein [Aquincola tertiaricarbonis]|uniref:type IV secretion system protein n=1 Tax=Aquincola tertiaricarbonis TaxID=391953 RepID=UPI000614D4A8|nr:type IV secretion system protein [Aquincola tertiaricarbonis]
MFTWLGIQLDVVLDGFVLGAVSSLMTGVRPVALTGMTLWIGLYGWAIARGEVNQAIPSLLWNVFKVGIILSLSLQSGLYVQTISDAANGLALGVATTFLPAAADASAVTSPYALIDAFTERALQLILELLKDAGILRLDLVLASILTALGTIVFLCVALFVVTLAKLLMAFVIAVGPLFVLCLAWRPTARFFDSWLSVVLNTVVLGWFAFFALGLSMYLGETIVQAVRDQGGFLGPTFNVVAETLKYCVVMVLMAIICFQAPGLAAALTGGAPVQQGLQMVQNAMMIAGLRSISHARSPSAAAGQGGTVRAGAGLLGHASAAAASAVSRTPAYRRAALRGQS